MFTQEVELKKELGFTYDDCLVIKKVKQIDNKGNEIVAFLVETKEIIEGDNPHFQTAVIITDDIVINGMKLSF